MSKSRLYYLIATLLGIGIAMRVSEFRHEQNLKQKALDKREQERNHYIDSTYID